MTTSLDTADSSCDTDCSLREALTAANASPGLDTITFNIPGPGPHVIKPGGSQLPAITDSVIIDGFTQPGASPNTNPITQGLNAVWKIELDGSMAGFNVKGFRIGGPGTVIRGLVIRNFNRGIDFGSGGALEGSVVTGNGLGLFIQLGHNNRIGGPAPQAANWIYGNSRDGIAISFGNGNTIQGNLIGTTIGAAAGPGNGFDNIGLDGDGNVILDNEIASGGDGGIAVSNYGNYNVISRNHVFMNEGQYGDGITFHLGGDSSPATGNVVRNNRVESNARHGILLVGFTGGLVEGNVVTANTENGIHIGSSAANRIGGLTAGSANIVSGNGGHGIVLAGGDGNEIAANSTFGNAGLGVDLWPYGVTPNDAGDADTGTNNLQNFPLITAVYPSGGATRFEGVLDSTPNTNFTLRFFASAQCDPSGYGEGEAYLGSATGSTDARGAGTFATTISAPIAFGRIITATASAESGDTSEFSACHVYRQNDADADYWPDNGDSCPYFPDPYQTDSDGDSVGDVCDPNNDNDMLSDLAESDCASDPLNDGSLPERTDTPGDDDGDGQANEPLPPTAEGQDCDGDGFAGSREAYLTTSDQDPCGNTGWPSDLFPGTPGGFQYNTFNVQDLGSFIAPVRRFGASPGSPNFSLRWDLVPGGTIGGAINLQDLAATVTGASGYPPMLGGQKAFGRTCPWLP